MSVSFGNWGEVSESLGSCGRNSGGNGGQTLISTFWSAEAWNRDVDVDKVSRIRLRIPINPGFNGGTSTGWGQGLANGGKSPTSVIEGRGTFVEIGAGKGCEKVSLLFGEGLESCGSSSHDYIVSYFRHCLSTVQKNDTLTYFGFGLRDGSGVFRTFVRLFPKYAPYFPLSRLFLSYLQFHFHALREGGA